MTVVKTGDMSVAELRAMLEGHRSVTVLDVRNAQARAEWAIPGSVHVDAYEALKAGDPAALTGVDLPRDRPVVTVCGAGKASLTAMEQLRARGYDAFSLAGGMKAWSLAWNVAEVPVSGISAAVVQVRRTGKGCLSYVIGRDGVAAVVDAALDPEVYVALAAERGWTIVHAIDTHVHADHLSRSRALAALTGATLHLPAQDRVSFPFSPVHDGDEIAIGGARLAAVRTPGHTLEATVYLLDGRALFTGDTLFLVAIGRPDLEASAEEARERARLLYRSLQRLATLPGETRVLPGHTSSPVAFDGEPVTGRLADILGRVEMLRLTEGAFVESILARIPPTPPNHTAIVAYNEAGELPAGDPTELEAGANRCAVA